MPVQVTGGLAVAITEADGEIQHIYTTTGTLPCEGGKEDTAAKGILAW